MTRYSRTAREEKRCCKRRSTSLSVNASAIRSVTPPWRRTRIQPLRRRTKRGKGCSEKNWLDRRLYRPRSSSLNLTANHNLSITPPWQRTEKLPSQLQSKPLKSFVKKRPSGGNCTILSKNSRVTSECSAEFARDHHQAAHPANRLKLPFQ